MSSLNRKQSIATKILVALTLLMCGFCGLGIAYSPMGTAARSEEDNLATLRKLGVAVTPVEMHAKHPIPKEGNAAPLVLPILKHLVSTYEDAAKIQRLKSVKTKIYYSDLTDQQRINIQSLLDKLTFIKKYNACAFERDYKLGFNVLYPEMSILKNAIKYLCMDAEYRYSKNNYDVAIGRIEVAAKLSSFSNYDHNTIGLLVRIASQAIVL